LIGLTKEMLKVANNFLEKIDNTYLKAIGIKRNAKAEAEAKGYTAIAGCGTITFSGQTQIEQKKKILDLKRFSAILVF